MESRTMDPRAQTGFTSASESESSRTQASRRRRPIIQSDFAESDSDGNSSDRRQNTGIFQEGQKMRRNSQRIAENNRRRQKQQQAPPSSAIDTSVIAEDGPRRSPRLAQLARPPNVEQALERKAKDVEIAANFPEDLAYLSATYGFTDFEQLRGNKKVITQDIIDRFEISWGHKFHKNSSYDTVYNYARRNRYYRR